jgi:hypothetical protein
MSIDETAQPTQDIPAVDGDGAASAGQSPLDAHRASESGGDPLPIAGAAFVGGFVLAKVLKKLGGGDN